ncbi:ABC transporter permease [Bacillus marasmi]|uniref:ABC transporter permease n=1 Tax=Bacillus marasmi TaxID=1926279 RepID=UPI0011CC4551|nr:ABC transporter permease [Bacillus marasmi]
MIGLIENEMIKIFRRPGTYVMLGLLIIVIAIAGVTMKYNIGNMEDNDPQWKQNLQMENDALKRQMESEKGQSGMNEYYKESIARNEYRIEHDLPPLEAYTIWSFVSDISQMIDFVGIFIITIAAGIVASEFNWGTIKLLLIRPISRAKILTSKYITVFLFGLLMLTITFLLSGILGAILFGFPDKPTPYLLYQEGVVSELPIGLYLIVYYCLKSINMVMLVTMAFMMSAVFRNSSLAIGLSIFLMFMGGNVTQLLAVKYEWAKYILFANTNLMQYFEGRPMIEGMSLSFSVVMLLLYFCLFIGLAYYVFKKRDITA